eukprot:Polyplicarium_translucidae@DN473_c0_g1_i2.p1
MRLYRCIVACAFICAGVGLVAVWMKLSLEEAQATGSGRRSQQVTLEDWKATAHGSCVVDEELFERIDKEMDVFVFAYGNSTPPPPNELARVYLKRDYLVYRVRNGRLQQTERHTSVKKAKQVEKFFDEVHGFAELLPDLEFVLSAFDEPRMAKNPCFREAYETRNTRLLEQCVDLPSWDRKHEDTTQYLRGSCPDTVARYSDAHGFFLSPSSSHFAMPSRPFPVFSFSKIDDCFDDVLVPWHFHLQEHIWDGGSIPAWDEKEDAVFWRGVTSGVESMRDEAYTKSHRFRLVDFTRSHRMRRGSPAFNVHFSGLKRCRAPICRRILAESRARVPFHLFSRAKYNVAIDGNTATLSELGLFRGNSIVLRDSIFSSYYSDWFADGRDYFSVEPDMTDFLEVLEAVARREAAAAADAASRSIRARALLTKGQMNCYWLRVLLRYAEVFPSARL